VKIGILTHQYINNYGAFLQAWALREAVKEMFPNEEVEIINYINRKHFIINVCGWFRFYRHKENLKCWIQKTKLPRTFEKARKKEMVLSSRCYNAQQINKLAFDCIIVGSDEVWNFMDGKGNTPIKFGIGLTCENLITYAPSVGKAVAGQQVPDYVKEGVKKFKAISARDDLTFELVKKITGQDAIRVLDPTFLVKFPMVKQNIAPKPYILFYYCQQLPESVLRQIFEYAHENNLNVYGAGECDRKYTKITVNLTPFEWIEMFRNAEFVFTGTFHGVVFSVMSKKQFKVYLTNESRIRKVNALLKELGIENRQMTQSFRFDLNELAEEINYDCVYQIIDEKRKISRAYLEKAIKESVDR